MNIRSAFLSHCVLRRLGFHACSCKSNFAHNMAAYLQPSCSPREAAMPEMVAKRSNPLAPLTEAEIRTTRAPAEGRLVLRDPVCRGLELRISAPSARYPDGTRSWSLEVR